MGRLVKLTDLFEEGVTVPLKAGDGSEVVVWLNKLSPFESEQAAHEGRVARARAMLAIDEIGTPESDLFRAASETVAVEVIITVLLDAKNNERTVKIHHELQSDKEWKEKLETLNWSSDQLKGKKDDDPEVKLVTKILADYQGEMASRSDFLRNEMRNELVALSPEKLRDMHRDSFRSDKGLAAFIREQAKSQIFYSLRVCEATRDDNGRWQHESCKHMQRWLDDRDDVDQLPGLLLSQVRAAYDELNMAPDVARFSGGPASSSESHGPSSKPEESKDSGPEVTSDEPAGTSLPLPTKP
jgi:hypothetical protein